MPHDGAPHPGGLHANRLALKRAREAQHATYLVDLSESGVKERLGDVLRPNRVAGTEDMGCVIAEFGAKVNRHDATLGIARENRTAISCPPAPLLRDRE